MPNKHANTVDIFIYTCIILGKKNAILKKGGKTSKSHYLIE